MRLIALSLAVAVAVASPSALSASARHTSWGKPDVSLKDYAADATECADNTRYVQAYIKPRTLRILDVLSSAQLLYIATQLAGSTGGGDALKIAADISSTHSAADIARRSNTVGGMFTHSVRDDTREELQSLLDKCLVEKGYRKIWLTNAQFKRLSGLKRHSAQRTSYLHSIDSDAELIARQSMSVK